MEGDGVACYIRKVLEYNVTGHFPKNIQYMLFLNRQTLNQY